MIKKEMTLDNGEKYIVGFKEVGTQKDGIECHILEKALFYKKSVYNKLYLKGMCPDYKQMAVWTILDYKKETEQQQDLLNAVWEEI